MSQPQADLIQAYDTAPLDSRYWTGMALAMTGLTFDYFDFYIVGFLVAVLAPQWHLTFGQTSIILLCAGAGAIIGSLTWGALADRFGRKRLMVIAIAMCSIGSGSVSLIPEGAWQIFAALRFVVGFGVGAAATVVTPLTVEYTPTRRRTLVASAVNIPISLGVLTASLTAAALLQQIGWRGLASLGYLQLIPVILITIFVPESVRWLVSKRRYSEARAIVARALKRPVDSFPLPNDSAPNVASGVTQHGFSELFSSPKRFWLTVIVWFAASTANYGVFLWGPTVVALLMGIPPQQVAHLFIVVSLSSMAGRALFSYLPHRYGRRRCGEIMGYGIAITLGTAAVFFDHNWFGYPAFVVMLIPAAIFFDGGFANIAPYAAEVFPVQSSARGMGLAQAANGVGKIAGPLCLALIAGADNFITPKATIDAVTPAFLFLATCGLAIGLAFTLLGIETHGKPLPVD